MKNDPKKVKLALARSIANRQVDDASIEKAAKAITLSTQQIRGIDVCKFGICLDYFLDKNIYETLPDLVVLDGARLRNIEIFPYGILAPDFFRVRVSQDFDALRGQLG